MVVLVCWSAWVIVEPEVCAECQSRNILILIFTVLRIKSGVPVVLNQVTGWNSGVDSQVTQVSQVTQPLKDFLVLGWHGWYLGITVLLKCSITNMVIQMAGLSGNHVHGVCFSQRSHPGLTRSTLLTSTTGSRSLSSYGACDARFVRHYAMHPTRRCCVTSTPEAAAGLLRRRHQIDQCTCVKPSNHSRSISLTNT